MSKFIFADAYDRNCPVRNILSRISDKWTMLTLCTIHAQDAPIRFGELQRAIPDISQKMLTVTLRTLEEDGLILRKAFAEVPPRVEYSLTERSQTLMPHIYNLIGWAKENIDGIMDDRWRNHKKRG